MLSEFVIRNFALVEDETFNFTDGLNILTGETGAGKSLIIDAVSFLLGASLRDKPLRSGAESGFAAARFTEIPQEVKNKACELGFECEDDEIILSRDFKASGRTCCRINGKPSALSCVRELGTMLVDLHGQHQQYSLLRASDHLRVLDKYTAAQDSSFSQLQNQYACIYKKVRDLEKELDDLNENERSRIREADWTRHELEEISCAEIKPGEYAELERKIKVLSSAAELHNGALSVHEGLGGDGALRDKLASLFAFISSLSAKDENLDPVCRDLSDALALIDDSIYELSAYADSVNADEAYLEQAVCRRELIRSVMRKYGPSEEDVLAYEKQASEKLKKLENSTVRCSELHKELETCFRQREELLDRISALRRRFAESLASEAEAELAKIGMEHCRFYVDFSDNQADSDFASEQEKRGAGFASKYRSITSSGGDCVQFLIAPNPGEVPKPLAMIASGGEVSRIMLALLSLFSEFQKNAVFFFDEIDAGLGGIAAKAVAQRLKNLAARSQVICITHLAVLAAAGKRHHHLYKEVCGGRTNTHAVILNPEERRKEIARMLSGDASESKALEHADMLLSESE